MSTALWSKRFPSSLTFLLACVSCFFFAARPLSAATTLSSLASGTPARAASLATLGKFGAFPMLAEGSSFDAPLGIAAWLACAAFVIMLINGGFKLARNVKGEESKPANPELHTAHQELHTKHGALEHRVGGVERSVESLRKEQQEQTLHLQTEASRRAKNQYEHVDKIRTELAAEIKKVDDKVSAVPHQTVALLRNTGVIKG